MILSKTSLSGRSCIKSMSSPAWSAAMGASILGIPTPFMERESVRRIISDPWGKYWRNLVIMILLMVAGLSSSSGIMI